MKKRNDKLSECYSREMLIHDMYHTDTRTPEHTHSKGKIWCDGLGESE